MPIIHDLYVVYNIIYNIIFIARTQSFRCVLIIIVQTMFSSDHPYSITYTTANIYVTRHIKMYIKINKDIADATTYYFVYTYYV